MVLIVFRHTIPRGLPIGEVVFSVFHQVACVWHFNLYILRLKNSSDWRRSVILNYITIYMYLEV